MEDNWYLIRNSNELDSPALAIYPDRVSQNITTLLSMVDHPDQLRPHAKTHKTREAAKLLLEAGIQKFKCATIAEAEMLGICEAPDVLLAYQPVGPKVLRLASLIKKYPDTRYSCLVDDLKTAQQIDLVFAMRQLRVPVFIDLNTGQNRTGIPPGQTALQLYMDCFSMRGIQPIGLHSYDGHIRDLDWTRRKQRCEEAFSPVRQMQETLQQAGLPKPVIVAGGSPTFSIHCTRKDIECSPGTFIFWDKGYCELCPEQSFVPAALVITRVVSLPSASKLCLDLGHKSVSAENEISRRVHFINAPELVAVGQSEEHLVVDAGLGHSYRPGDLLYGLPVHICPTVALYERAFTVEEGLAVGEWKIIARDRKITV